MQYRNQSHEEPVTEVTSESDSPVRKPSVPDRDPDLDPDRIESIDSLENVKEEL